jgi:phage repressor protein C with HTH and peptisase S24 domain/DNA-binding XRE family transcriptional regulator
MINSDLTPSAVAKLFKARRLALDLTQEQVALKVSAGLPPNERLSQQSYAAFERGKTQSSRHMMQIATALGLDWETVSRVLFPGLSPMNATPATDADPAIAAALSKIEVWDDETPIVDDEVEVPLLKEVEDGAGSGRVVVQADSRAKLRFSKATLRNQKIEPANVIGASVYGNSMEPVLPHGSTVGIDQGRTALKDGDLYAIDHNGHLRVKLIYRLPSGGMRLRSYNRDEHPDEEYTPDQVNDQQILIIGRVFWYSVLR